jgi:hypothetical protein
MYLDSSTGGNSDVSFQEQSKIFFYFSLIPTGWSENSKYYFHRGDFRVSILYDPPFRLQVLDILRFEFPDFPFKYNISKVLRTVLFQDIQGHDSYILYHFLMS